MQQYVPMAQISEINMQQTFHVLQYTIVYISSPGGSGMDSYFLQSFLGPGSTCAITSWSLYGPCRGRRCPFQTTNGRLWQVILDETQYTNYDI